MQVLILHNAIPPSAGPEEQDTLWQVQAVRDSLLRSQHSVDVLPVTLNLSAVAERVQTSRPEIVFNLVESLAGTDRMIAVVPQLLETFRVPYTGASADVLLLTSHKLWAKERLRALGLPTADWWDDKATTCGRRIADSASISGGSFQAIIKPIGEHGSVGMLEDNVVTAASSPQLVQVLAEFQARSERRLFAERFIDGREVNVSLLAGRDGPYVLPPAEILFPNYPEKKPRVVCYKAKWTEDSFEYQNTPRTFEFASNDLPLLEELKRLAVQCWELFELRGYARVDFRIDAQLRPWILEINANPCLTPEGGFWAALQHAGIQYDTAIQQILESAFNEQRCCDGHK